MRISDWSSDVCSSDLSAQAPGSPRRRASSAALDARRSAPSAAASTPVVVAGQREAGLARPLGLVHRLIGATEQGLQALARARIVEGHPERGAERMFGVAGEIGRASCRERVGQYV